MASRDATQHTSHLRRRGSEFLLSAGVKDRDVVFRAPAEPRVLDFGCWSVITLNVY